MIPRIAIDVIYELWPILVLCSVVLVTLRLVYLYTNKKPFVLYKELISLSFVLYIMLLFELVTSSDYYAYGNNFIPFKEILRYSLNSESFYKNVIGNMIIFIPFGYFTSYFCKHHRFYFNIIITFITSFTIEAIQAGIGRAFDIDDIILNVVGSFSGYLIYLISEKILRKYPETFKNHLLLNFIFLIIMFVLVFIILGLYGAV